MINKLAPALVTCTGVSLAGSIMPENNTTLILQILVIAFNVVSEIVKHRKINKLKSNDNKKEI